MFTDHIKDGLIQTNVIACVDDGSFVFRTHVHEPSAFGPGLGCLGGRLIFYFLLIN